MAGLIKILPSMLYSWLYPWESGLEDHMEAASGTGGWADNTWTVANSEMNMP